ncbi:MAG: hypothetical protein F4Z74_06430 [Acidobacteria bacterium]|nr:hypothetical protein [Acidobacteriota bacterium]MYE42941.1 hypothetical protein [Acidobacteriota bacterium]
MRRPTTNTAYRSAVGVALMTAVLLFWVNGAVGIIGGDGNDANLLYGGVVAVAAIGALMARFRPQGMSRALAGTALAQFLVPVIVVSAGLGTAPAWSWDILILSGFFAALWCGSALLFRKAARERVALPA